MLQGNGPGARVRGGGGIELGVLEAGNPSGTPVLFIHGYLQSAASWRKQFESDLARDFRLIALDLRGHGTSEKPAASEAYSDSKLWADDVAAVMEQLDLRRCVVAGWSYAGYVISDYLRFYGAERLGALMLIAAVTRRGDANVRSFADPRFAQLFPALFSADRDEYLNSLGAMIDLLAADPNAIDTATRAQIVAAAEGIPALARAGMQRRNADNDDILSKLSLPAVCIHGAQDAVVVRASSEHNVRTIAGAQLSIYENAGHSPFFEEPERFNRDVRALAARVR